MYVLIISINIIGYYRCQIYPLLDLLIVSLSMLFPQLGTQERFQIEEQARKQKELYKLFSRLVSTDDINLSEADIKIKRILENISNQPIVKTEKISNKFISKGTSDLYKSEPHRSIEETVMDTKHKRCHNDMIKKQEEDNYIRQYCPFQPTILPLSKQLASHRETAQLSVSDRLLQFGKEKEAKQSLLREEANAKPPIIKPKKYKRIKSTIVSHHLIKSKVEDKNNLNITSCKGELNIIEQDKSCTTALLISPSTGPLTSRMNGILKSVIKKTGYKPYTTTEPRKPIVANIKQKTTETPSFKPRVDPISEILSKDRNKDYENSVYNRLYSLRYSNTPRDNKIQSTPRDNKIQSTPRDNKIQSTPRDNKIQSTPRDNKIQSTPRDNKIQGTPNYRKNSKILFSNFLNRQETDSQLRKLTLEELRNKYQQENNNFVSHKLTPSELEEHTYRLCNYEIQKRKKSIERIENQVHRYSFKPQLNVTSKVFNDSLLQPVNDVFTYLHENKNYRVSTPRFKNNESVSDRSVLSDVPSIHSVPNRALQSTMVDTAKYSNRKSKPQLNTVSFIERQKAFETKKKYKLNLLKSEKDQLEQEALPFKPQVHVYKPIINPPKDCTSRTQTPVASYTKLFEQKQYI